MIDDFSPYPLAMERFPTLRQSLLSNFDSCSLSAGFDVEYRKGWSTQPQGRGQLFHQVAGACLRQMAESREETIPVDAALAILQDVLRQEHTDRICPECGTTEILPGIWEDGQKRCGEGHTFESEWVNVPLAMVKDLHWTTVKWANDNAFDIANLVDVELPLKAEIVYPNRDHGGVVPRTLTGTLDALFIEGSEAERAIVNDWKDMWSVPAAHEGDEDDAISFTGYFQQRFYGLLIFKRFPSVQQVTLREVYVRYSQVREASMFRSQLPEIEDQLSALTERFDRLMNDYLSLSPLEYKRAVKTGRLPFLPTPGKHCGYCIRPGACPIPQFAREEGRIIDERHAQDVAYQILVAEQVLKAARKDLRAFADTHGPVPITDKKGKRAFGYVESTRTEKPTVADVERAMLNKGGPLDLAEMRALYKTKTVTTFKAHVPGPPVDEKELEADMQAQLEASIAASQPLGELHVLTPKPKEVLDEPA